jgi:hypothetical protein
MTNLNPKRALRRAAACIALAVATAIALLGLPAHAQKISADPTASALAGGEFLAGVQSGANVKVLPSQIVTYSLANFTSVNNQVGTTYTYVSGDRGKLVTHSNASAIAGTLPQATGSFAAGWFVWVQNRGAGTLTITPTTSTIDGAATLVLTTSSGAYIVSDGTNYFTQKSVGGALTNFTESVNSASPNGTIPVVRLIATNAAAGVDIALTPKGSTGSLLAQIPDSTSTGGNKRGNAAVDWQLTRSTAAQVASGTNATIGGGDLNTASGNQSTVAGGESNTANSLYATVGGGSGNTAGSRGTVVGGVSNTVSGLYAVAGGNTNTVAGTGAFSAGESNTGSGDDSFTVGKSNTADAQYSSAIGGNATTRTLIGAFARANGQRSALGDNQVRAVVLRAQTTSATGVVATSNAGAAGTTNQICIPTGSALKFRAQVVLRDTATSNAGWFDVSGGMKNSAGTVSIIGTTSVSAYQGDAGLNTSTVTVSADNTNKCVQFTNGGVAATTINWTVDVEAVELQ